MVLSPEDENKLRNQYRVTLILWFAMVVSILIYLGFGLFFIESQQSSIIRGFRFVFYTLSVVSILVSRFLRSILLSSERILNALSDGVLTLGALLLGYYVVTFAFCESIAIYGLIIYILSGLKVDLCLLSALSLISFVFNYPKFEFWRETYERASIRAGRD
jgi:hypothetical protein